MFYLYRLKYKHKLMGWKNSVKILIVASNLDEGSNPSISVTLLAFGVLTLFTVY